MSINPKSLKDVLKALILALKDSADALVCFMNYY